MKWFFYLLLISLTACSRSPAKGVLVRPLAEITRPAPPATQPGMITPGVTAPVPSETTAPPVTTDTPTAPTKTPVMFSAAAIARAGDVIFLAGGASVAQYQDGQIRTLYTWPAALENPLVDFSGDGRFLAARMNDGDIALLDLDQGNLLHMLRIGADFSEWPLRLALAEDGSKLAVALGENTVQVWNVQTGEKIAAFTQPGSGVTYQSLIFSPDGKSLAGGFMNTVTHWAMETNQPVSFNTGCRGDTVFHMAYSPSGKEMAVVCGPSGNPVGFLTIWSLAENRSTAFKDEIPQMQRVAYSADGNWIAAGGPDGRIMVWDTRAGIGPIFYKAAETAVRDLLFSADGSSLIVALKDQVVFLRVAEIVPQ